MSAENPSCVGRRLLIEGVAHNRSSTRSSTTKAMADSHYGRYSGIFDPFHPVNGQASPAHIALADGAVEVWTHLRAGEKLESNEKRN